MFSMHVGAWQSKFISLIFIDVSDVNNKLIFISEIVVSSQCVHYITCLLSWGHDSLMVKSVMMWRKHDLMLHC